MKMRLIFKYLLVAGITTGALICGMAFADVASGIAMTDLSKNVGTTVGYLSTILSDTTTVAGVGFALGSFFKFHQHKLNPTQVPISHAITLLMIASGMLVFPWILTSSKRTVFGSANVAQIGGSDLQKVIGKQT